MCGRYTIAKDQEAFSGYFGAEFSETHRPIYNASPGQCLPVILDVEPDRIPACALGDSHRFARSSPAHALKCAVGNRRPAADVPGGLPTAPLPGPCDGFYEWQTTRWGKQPYRIVLSTDEPFAFAGIWRERQGEPEYVILTTEQTASCGRSTIGCR